MRVIVFPHNEIRAYRGADADDKVIPGRRMTLAQMGERAFDTDAHFVGYDVLDTRTAPAFRRTLGSFFDERAPEVFLFTIAVDVDTEGHVPLEQMSAQAQAAFWDKLETAMDKAPEVFDGCGFYKTRCGARFLLIPSSPISMRVASAWLGALWAKFREIGFPADEACKDPTRMSRANSVVRASGPVREPLQVPTHEMSWTPDPALLTEGVCPRHSKVSFDNVTRPPSIMPPKKTDPMIRMLRNMNPRLAEILCNGQPIETQKGHRHHAILHAVGTVVRACKIHTPSSVMQLLGHSVLLLDSDRDWWTETLEITKSVLSYDLGRREAEQEDEEAAQQEAENIYQDIANFAGVTPDVARRMLVLCCGNMKYLWNRSAKLYEECPSASEGFAATIRSAFGDLYDPSDPSDYTRVLSNAKIIMDIGTSIQSVSYNWLGQNSYDARRRVLRLSTVTPYAGEAVFDPDINQWLKLLGGEVLLDWVACFPRVERPIAAAYIISGPETGKTLLARCLAGWFGRPYASFDSTMSTFNSEQLNSPMIYGDEGLGSGGIKEVAAHLRQMIGTPETRVNRKFKDSVEVEGNVRALFSANNAGILRFGSSNTLTEGDFAAIAERVRVIVVPDDKAVKDFMFDVRARYARSKGFADPLDPKAPNVFETWLNGKFSAHMKWLLESREVKAGSRYLVVGDVEGEWAKDLRVQGRDPNLVLSALARAYCPKDSKGGGMPDKSVMIVKDEYAYVQMAGLESNWTKYGGNGLQPDAKAMLEALRALSEGTQKTVRRDGVQFRAWVVPVYKVRDQAVSMGLVVPDGDETIELD